VNAPLLPQASVARARMRLDGGARLGRRREDREQAADRDQDADHRDNRQLAPRMSLHCLHLHIIG
jgi:hypothetical protein